MELIAKFPNLKFAPGTFFSWSPRKRVIFYDKSRLGSAEGQLALLHEIGHFQLGHKDYEYDIELINMEVAAWKRARELASQFRVPINEEHINSCLETYRIWLHKRSLCPNCDNTSLQESPYQYRCFLCQSRWEVAATCSLQPRRMRCFTPPTGIKKPSLA